MQGILYICALHIEFCRIFLAYLLAYPNLLGIKSNEFLVGFKSIRVAIFYAGLPKPNATLLLYPGLGPAMLRRLRRESLPVSIDGV